MEDKELIQLIQNGHKEYLNEIAGKYYDDIFYFCCYQKNSREEACVMGSDVVLEGVDRCRILAEALLKLPEMKEILCANKKTIEAVV